MDKYLLYNINNYNSYTKEEQKAIKDLFIIEEFKSNNNIPLDFERKLSNIKNNCPNNVLLNGVFISKTDLKNDLLHMNEKINNFEMENFALDL